jgi:hypothetical protein
MPRKLTVLFVAGYPLGEENFCYVDDVFSVLLLLNGLTVLYLLLQRLHEPLVSHEVTGHVDVTVVHQDTIYLGSTSQDTSYTQEQGASPKPAQ